MSRFCVRNGNHWRENDPEWIVAFFSLIDTRVTFVSWMIHTTSTLSHFSIAPSCGLVREIEVLFLHPDALMSIVSLPLWDIPPVAESRSFSCARIFSPSCAIKKGFWRIESSIGHERDSRVILGFFRLDPVTIICFPEESESLFPSSVTMVGFPARTYTLLKILCCSTRIVSDGFKSILKCRVFICVSFRVSPQRRHSTRRKSPFPDPVVSYSTWVFLSHQKTIVEFAKWIFPLIIASVRSLSRNEAPDVPSRFVHFSSVITYVPEPVISPIITPDPSCVVSEKCLTPKRNAIVRIIIKTYRYSQKIWEERACREEEVWGDRIRIYILEDERFLVYKLFYWFTLGCLLFHETTHIE